MITRTHSVLAVTAAMFIAGAAVAAPAPPVYVSKAGASDMYEKKSSQLVLATTKNADIRRFADQMVKDHTTSTAEVKAAAQKSGLTPKSPKLDAKQTRMVSDLTRAKGTERDRLYIEQQRAAHQEALALHKDYAATGTAAPLKAAAAKIAPVVQHHIDELSRMSM
ncbi:DUF4142 domain-containing protein [uncultured Sphingomonas sp.]|uniref:DUF4142 domain-containing protein n=1 Tax=uncultured Sphingomonas sp. TaxID=158754 RepID=UPI0025F6169F|nr:DUF4142 domain-containing protein [uncultured Sphingomonas sp.]